jgi:hypothetical protein
MIYQKDYIEGVISRVAPAFKALGHSQLADVIHSSGQLKELSHRQLRRLISDYRDAHKESGNILFVGDLHAPFILPGYLEFCKGLYAKHSCSRVIFIGDLLDQHAMSFHTTDPDGFSPGDELKYAKKQLIPWYEAFPITDVMMGNHDFRIQRQAKGAGLPKFVLKPYKEVIEAPEGWTFHDNDLELDNDILVTHGSIGDAITRAKDARQSVIQGHLHTKAYVQWAVSNKDKIFGMQTGCGLDRSSYAAAYANDNAKKPVIAAGLLLDGGKLPVVELMNL